MRESLQNEVVLNEVPLRGFRLLMSYIYNGQLKLGELDVNTILEVLGIAHLYGVAKLETRICQHLGANLSAENVCSIYSRADFPQLEELRDRCRRFIFEAPETILASRNFSDFSEAALCDVLSEDAFYAKEIDIFKAVSMWVSERRGMDSGVLKVVRLPLIDTKDLVTTVKDSGLIPMNLLVDAIRARECQTTDVRIRAVLKVGVNLASEESGAIELDAIDHGDEQRQKSVQEFEREPLSSNPRIHRSTGLLIELKQPSVIDTIAFKLDDEEDVDEGVEGFVATSVNFVDWVDVKGSGGHWAISNEYHFESRVARYVRISHREDTYFDLETIEVSHR